MENIILDHSAQVLVNLEELCSSAIFSDVTFVVQNERISAHRLILASRCEYFRALLYGGLEESKLNEITLDVSLTSFKYLLRYIYTGALELKDVEQDDVLNLLRLSHEYGITTVVKALSDHLCKAFSHENVCTILEVALLLDIKDLIAACYDFLDAHASKVMKHDSFYELTFDRLSNILDRNGLVIEEIQIFEAITKWCTKNKPIEVERKKLYGKVYYAAISQNDLLSIVRPTGVLNSDELLNIIDGRDGSTVLPSRYKLALNRNVAKHVEMKVNANNQVIFDLRKCYFLNFIDLKIEDYDDYYEGRRTIISISVSTDGKTWVEIDLIKRIRPHYEVVFSPQRVRYVRYETIDYDDEEISLTAMFRRK